MTLKKKYLRKCILKGCNVKFEPLGPNHVACSWPHGIEYAKNVLKKNAKQEEKDWKKEKKIRKEKLKNLEDWKGDLQDEINRTARLIDRGWGCISCTSMSTPQAGHLHSRKANPAIRYNLHNLWTQDTHCNQYKSGANLKYLAGLMEHFGKEYMEFVQFDIVRLYPSLKLTIPEIKEKLKIVRAENRKLEKNLEPFTLEQRKGLRTYYNQVFGMYNE